MDYGTGDFQVLWDAVCNWGRWGPDDTLGTLNLADAAATRRGVERVQSGRRVSCSRSVGFRKSIIPNDNVIHMMTRSGADAPEVGEGGAADWVAVGLHGISFTHVDAFSHVFWNGQMYNGRDKGLVTTDRGAVAGGLEPIFNGVVSRGVLIDAAELNGGSALAAGTALGPEDLAAALERTGVALEPGDVLYVRTGYGESPLTDDERPTAGLSGRCMPMLHEAGISVLVSDGINDADPSGFESVHTPVHVLGLVAMGLWLIDNAGLADLAASCREEGRYDFLTTIAPVPLRRATGSLVNPLAVF